VRRHRHLQPLSDDHHGALVLARRIGLAAKQDPERDALTEMWDDLRRRFARELEPHFRVEEERLFPQLDLAGEHALVERARADHARLRELVRTEPDPVVAAHFAALLHRHVRFEERELFTRAESLLPLSALEAASRAALAAREACHMPSEKALEPGHAKDFAHQLTEAVRKACVDAAIDGYERASISGVCHEGAWEAAVSAIRMAALDALAERPAAADSESGADTPVAAESLRDVALTLARRFASPGAPAAGSAAAATGAIAAGLLEWTAGLSALRGPEGFRKRARSIAIRGAALQSSLSSAAHTDAELVERWMRTRRDGREDDPEESASCRDAATNSVLDVAARCAQVTTLAAEVAKDGHAAVRHDAAAALRLAASAAECALALAEANLCSAGENDWARNTKRRMWRTRLLLRRVRPAVEDGGSE
jgi:formiminotetrahydrofolate cyclodeaminase